MNEFLKVVERA